VNRIELCAECDHRRFPQGRNEGYINLCEWRERIMDAKYHTPHDWLMALMHDADEPNVSIQFDGRPVLSTSVMELQAGGVGWMVLFSDDQLSNERCPTCGDETMLVLVFGHVEFSASPSLAVAS
jgi:hypothetical protein